MESFSALKVFAQTAEAGSFVGAGRRIGLSASAVGKSIARLEERFGVRLFHRSTHSVTLTPEGVLFLDRCRRILAEMESATQELSLSHMAVRGPIRVSLPTWAVFFMPTFGKFMQAYPAARLDIDLTDRLVDLIGEGYDLVLRTGDVRDSRLMGRVIGRFKHAIVASPSYLAVHGTPERPEDLRSHLCLHRRHPETGKIDAWPLARGDADHALDLPVAAVVNTVEARIELAERGAGIACVPADAVAAQIGDGRLQTLLDGHLLDAGTIRLLWPADLKTAYNIRTLIDFIVERH
jgi:DNA-binding transcriptional LysR family regulator